MLPALAALAGGMPASAAEPSFVRESRYVPARDGTRLAMNVYLPAIAGKAGPGPYPVIFAFTPYRARYRNAQGAIVELDLMRRYGLEALLAEGYALALADIRGKGASFGARRGFQDRTEANDGHDLVQWLAAQPWSSGKVGMVGCSYLGGTTVHVASTAPPALKAIFTGATDLDKYAFVRRGGITAQFNTRPDEPLSDDLQSVPVDADPDGVLLRAAVAEHAGNTPMAALWYGMPFRDSVSEFTGNRFWEEVGPYTYLDALKKSGIAMYFWGNWQDEPVEQMILAAANLDSKLLVGPGSHCVPPPDFDLAGELRRYFDRYLKNVDNGIDREPRYTYRIDEAPAPRAWIRGDRLPGADVPRTSFHFSAARSGTAPSINDGTLAERSGAAAADSFTADYGVGDSEYFAFWIESQAAHGLTYTGPALASDRALIGFPIIQLRLAADRAEARVFAYLEDVAPDGKATVVAFGRLAASQRKLAVAPYDTLGLPWPSGRIADARPLTPGEPVELRFALTPAARIFHAGHRLRVTITGADPRQRNLAELREDPPPRIEVLLGGDAASRIELPLLAPGELPRR